MTANVKNIRALKGWLYVRPLDKQHFVHCGHVESVTRNLEIAREPLYVSGSGVRKKGDTVVNEVSANLSIVLREDTAFNIALASASDTDLVYTQEAATGVMRSGTNVKAGDAIHLSCTGATNVVLTDGSDELIRMLDYDLDAELGVIEFKRDIPTYDLVFDKPAIVSADRRSKIALLQRPEGITCEFMIKQTQKRGEKRWKYVHAIGTIFPEGDLTLIKEGSEMDTITLTAELIPNPNVPEDDQYGVMIPA